MNDIQWRMKMENKGWYWDSKTHDFYRWEDLPIHRESPHIEMWKHFCKRENAWMGIEKGQMCKWCGLSEKSC